MKSDITPYPFYDLSNRHFQRAELILKDKKTIKGQFVQFKVVSLGTEWLYPGEKFCFLPEEHKNTFWSAYNANNGEFKKVPDYIKQYGFNDIERIIIEPQMIL